MAMTDCQGEWALRDVKEDGAGEVHVYRCTGCREWLVCFPGGAANVEADTIEEAVRKALAP